MEELFTNETFFGYVILPGLIFIARIFDVSIATIRIVYLSRGEKWLVPILGFFEVLIWVIALSQIFKHLDNPVSYIAYAAGFAAGNLVGILIEEKIALGYQVVRIISRAKTEKLTGKLRKAGFGTTLVDGQGATGPVKIIFSLARRRDMPGLIELIKQSNPKAFYTIENVHHVKEPIMPLANGNTSYWRQFKLDRRRK